LKKTPALAILAIAVMMVVTPLAMYQTYIAKQEKVHANGMPLALTTAPLALGQVQQLG
jgi:hypothetical protein